MDSTLDEQLLQDSHQSDDELDAFNQETFGDDNDEWDWESQQENTGTNENTSSKSNLQLHSSVITSKSHSGSLPPLPDVSVIRSVADLEQDFLRESTGSTSRTNSSPNTLDRALLSIDPSKVLHASDIEQSMMSDSNKTRTPTQVSNTSSSQPLNSSNIIGLRPLPDMSSIKSHAEIEADLLASSANSSSSPAKKVWPQSGTKSLEEIESEILGLKIHSPDPLSNQKSSPSVRTSNSNSLSVFPNLPDSSIWAPPEYSSLFPPLGSEPEPSPSKSAIRRQDSPEQVNSSKNSAPSNVSINPVAQLAAHSTPMRPTMVPMPVMMTPHGIVGHFVGQPYPIPIQPMIPGARPVIAPLMSGIRLPPGVPSPSILPNASLPMPIRPGMPLIPPIPMLPNGQRLPMPMPPVNLFPGPTLRQLFPPQLHQQPHLLPQPQTNAQSKSPMDSPFGRGNNRNVDEYAGLMTQDERRWLTKIQRLQLEGSMTDPYVDDYYSMAYQTKKIEEAKNREVKAKNREPTVMIIERPNKTPSTPQGTSVSSAQSSVNCPSANSTPNQRNATYTPRQFEGSLGKLQAVSLKCPRKLLDLNALMEEVANDSVNNGNVFDEATAPLAKKELRKLRMLLLDIERLYLILLKVDYCDKRMVALPVDGRKELEESRKQLCQQLFDGITEKPQVTPEQQTPSKGHSLLGNNNGRSQQLKMLFDTMTNSKLAQQKESAIDLTSKSRPKLHSKIASIRKGAALIFRSLSILHEPHHKAVLISDLIGSNNFHLVVLQKDKALYGLDYAEILIDALKSLESNISVDVLLLLSQGLNEASNVARYPCGEEIIQQILHLSSVLLTNYPQQLTPDFTQRWETFLLQLIDDVDDIPELRKLVLVQQEQLKIANQSFSRSLPNGSRSGLTPIKA